MKIEPDLKLSVIPFQELTPGSIIVLRTDLKLSNEQFQKIKEILRGVIPESYKIMVLEQGMSLEIIKREESSDGI